MGISLLLPTMVRSRSLDIYPQLLKNSKSGHVGTAFHLLGSVNMYSPLVQFVLVFRNGGIE